MFGSFRLRLIVAFIALFALFSVSVSFVGLVLREQNLRASFDRELNARADVIRLAIREDPTRSSENLDRALREMTHGAFFNDFFVQIIDGDNKLVAKSANLGDASLPALSNEQTTDEDNLPPIQTVRPVGPLPGHAPTSLRATRMTLDGADGQPFYVIVAADTKPISDSIRVTRWLFIGGNLGGLAAAAAAAWYVTGAWSRRLEEMVTQLEKVTPENLTHRVQMPNRDEISALATHINKMLDRLRAGFDTQERFIHDASHELKTPVATVQAEAQALLLSEPTREELLDFVHAANDEMRRLGRLTEALLLLTHSTEAKLTDRFAPLDITDAATAAIGLLTTMAADHRVRLTVNMSPDFEGAEVRGDPDLLDALISNLIRNAIRFSPRAGEVQVNIDATDAEVIIVVNDQGPGIPEDILPRIFDRYFESSQTRVRRGAGLGLAIAATVARLHGGSISAQNRTNSGASLITRLPRYNPDGTPADPDDPDTPHDPPLAY